MCGVMAYLSKTGEGPDIGRLKVIAQVTESRGDHAHGFAWIDGTDGKMRWYKCEGPISRNLDALDQCKNAIAFIGHTRFATHGDANDHRNNHPHAAGDGFIVHNGVVGNWAELKKKHDLQMTSDCDSEVIGLLYEQHKGRPIVKFEKAFGQLQHSGCVVLGLWHSQFIAGVRDTNPLCLGAVQRGVYMASLMAGLPTNSEKLKDDQIFSFGRKGNKFNYNGNIKLERQNNYLYGGANWNDARYSKGTSATSTVTWPIVKPRAPAVSCINKFNTDDVRLSPEIQAWRRKQGMSD